MVAFTPPGVGDRRLGGWRPALGGWRSPGSRHAEANRQRHQYSALMLLAVSGKASEAQVRQLHPDDAGRVAQLLEQLGYPAEQGEVRKRIDTWARDDRGVAFGVTIDDGLAGCAAIHVIPFFERPGARARLVALVVDAEYRRRGIASVLVEHCRNFARQHGATEIEVTSRRTRTEADPFYTGIGFADVSDRSRRYISDL